MSLNSYSETCIHDLEEKPFGESNVFRIDYPDGIQQCIKEYYPTITSPLLSDYHKLHNYLSQYPVDFDVDLDIEDRHFHKVRFSVLALRNHISPATSFKHKKEIMISVVPYV